ncbi:hypothetical protein [Helicobacter canis]|uniref:hypothetical protein n=1 Tax=Helicobacter canis TaxID=29419 RepID=UPI0015F064C8|nr:hypothetical protein [Helicobacter canis]
MDSRGLPVILWIAAPCCRKARNDKVGDFLRHRERVKRAWRSIRNTAKVAKSGF